MNSDHVPISIILSFTKLSANRSEENKSLFFNYKKADWVKFKQSLPAEVPSSLANDLEKYT